MKMRTQVKKESASAEDEPDDMEVDIPRKLYCEDIFGGFRASAKLESMIEDYHKLPSDEKVLICSFFKGRCGDPFA